jgi:DNA-binding response OmpR family regulator
MAIGTKGDAFAAGSVDVESMTLAAAILIFHDDVEMRQLLGEELHDLGHRPIYAADRSQAVSLARGAPPDLILLDLCLAGDDGFSVLEQLQSIANITSVPVIVFSNLRSPQTEERALSLGAREFVQKTLRGNALFDAIARVLDGRASAQDASPPISLPPLSFAASVNG